jgi:drug/metabolite transporter (DMT)-like permease
MANFQVFFLALFGTIILKEKSGWKLFVSIPTAILGLYLIVAPNWSALGEEYRAGVTIALLAAISYAAYILVLRNFQSKFTVSALSTIGLVALIASFILALEALVINESFVIPDLQSWFALVDTGSSSGSGLGTHLQRLAQNRSVSGRAHSASPAHICLCLGHPVLQPRHHLARTIGSPHGPLCHLPWSDSEERITAKEK